MNRKEAIYRQDVLDLAKKGVLISNGSYKSVCKAINELPPVNPIEPCKDAIDRAEAVRVASGYCHPANVAKELAKLPPVTPQPKTGHWIESRQDDGMSDPIYYQVRCSECGFGLDPQTWHMELRQYGADKFCPNCGCRMFDMQESEADT